MRFFRHACVLAAACWLRAADAPQVPGFEEFRQRRIALRRALDAPAVFFGATETVTGNLRHGFLQDPAFFYLTGWNEPGAALLMGETGDVLFLPPRESVRERFTGPKTDAAEKNLERRTGFDQVLPLDDLEPALANLRDSGARVYSLREGFADASPALTRLRMKKSMAEVERIRRSVAATIGAHRAAWKQVRPGAFEYQIASTLAAYWTGRGCERSAYLPIVASGPNSVILHYSRSARRLESGDLVVIDAGAECASYAADVTRTLPVSGRFTSRQRELYEAVLDAQEAAIAAIRPGMSLGRTSVNSLHQIALRRLDARGGLGRYFMHDLGHHVGLEVHDPYDENAALEPGMIITIEPGVYLPEEEIGVRIEDMVLVTDKGGIVLTSALPKRADDIERAMAR